MSELIAVDGCTGSLNSEIVEPPPAAHVLSLRCGPTYFPVHEIHQRGNNTCSKTTRSGPGATVDRRRVPCSPAVAPRSASKRQGFDCHSAEAATVPPRSHSPLDRSGVSGNAANEAAKPKSCVQGRRLAGEQIDKLSDPSATAEEQQQRKRRLLKGPKEFRDIRGDFPKPKT